MSTAGYCVGVVSSWMAWSCHFEGQLVFLEAHLKLAWMLKEMGVGDLGKGGWGWSHLGDMGIGNMAG